MMRKTWIKRSPKKQKPAGAPRRKLEGMGYWDLVKILDAEFSFNLRAGTAAKLGSPFVQCYTCDTFHHWKDTDCGHFEQRDQMGTRYDPRNTRIQCHICNRYNEGKKAKFGQRLMRDGVDVNSVMALAGMWGKAHIPMDQMIKDIKEFRKANAKIRKEIRGME